MDIYKLWNEVVFGVMIALDVRGGVGWVLVYHQFDLFLRTVFKLNVLSGLELTGRF